MKLEQKVFEIEKSEGLKEYKFKLPENPVGVKLIVDLLSSSLYSNKLESSIREIYTNALDANIEASSSTPIDITLPDSDNPFISFRDYGLGMDPDKVVNTYINLGASTKRDTNELHGGLKSIN